MGALRELVAVAGIAASDTFFAQTRRYLDQMEDLRLEAVPVVARTLMESLVIT
jgi:hypothetical protein